VRALGLAGLPRNLGFFFPNRQLITCAVRGTRVFVFVASFFVRICTFILGKQVNWVRVIRGRAGGIRGRVASIRRRTLLILPIEFAPLDEVLCEACRHTASIQPPLILY
jgi:hypothetical protein